MMYPKERLMNQLLIMMPRERLMNQLLMM
jgi:hypothetical protein